MQKALLSDLDEPLLWGNFSGMFMKLGESGRALGSIYSVRTKREFSKIIEYLEIAAKMRANWETERSGVISSRLNGRRKSFRNADPPK